MPQNNIFLKSAGSIWKIVVACILVYFTAGLFWAKTESEYIFGFCLLVFVTFPTIFIVYFKKSFMVEHSKFVKPWKFLRIGYILVIVIFFGAVSFGLYRAYEKNITQKAIDFINSKKIILADVIGKNLPPVPDQKLNDSTIAGIDINNNYIRDDVELEIFKKYPNSAKIRAAELQYAQSLQLELTKAFNSQTLVPIMQKEGLAFDCLGFSGPDTSLASANSKEKEVEDFVLNTNLRKKYYSMVSEKYMTGYASLSGYECDTRLSLLPN